MTGERFRQAIWAGLVAFVLSISTLLIPLDEFTWILQSRFANFRASGDIAFVGTPMDMTDPAFPQRRIELADKLDVLRQRGVERVYLDMAFRRPSTPAADARLNQALRAFDGRSFLVSEVGSGINGELELRQSDPAIAQGVGEVGTMRWQNYLGNVWELPQGVEHGNIRLNSLHASLAGQLRGDQADQINYGFARSTIPTFTLNDFTDTPGPLGIDRASPASLAGKTVVLGAVGRGAEQVYNIPGHRGVPPSMIDIYGAETVRAGFVRLVPGWAVILVALGALLGLTQVPRRRVRYAGYASLLLLLSALVPLAAREGVTTSFAGALAMLGVYTAMRLRAHWQSTLRLVDPETRLPTFAAMEADPAMAESAQSIIVARLHRFEEVKRTLPSELHAEYMLRLIARLRAAKPDAVIYLGPGNLIAWTFPEKEPALVREHLEGLRALFSAPLLVGNNQVDVRVTFGVDLNPSPNVPRRLAAAIDAAERTTETYEPIVIAESATDEDLIWNISLQARIDAALANGEIYMIYQPKVLVQTGEIVGVEALVRWRDPVKGLIPPDHFIRQCENAGRMSHLTQHALTQSCMAGRAFAEHGMPIPVAVNISATLVHEPLIVAMVSEVLRETGFDAQQLTLEITETYRISNFDRAAEVMGDLAALGVKMSMDDFGVGAASLEALQRLPFTELKIDRLFVAAMSDTPKAQAIVRNVLQLGRDLRIVVVAEGVENAATLRSLRDAGCLVAQGFGIARPTSYDEILQFQQVTLDERLKFIV